ncbi:MAG: hydroxymethylglutaryl-CoA lyase [Roseococcus sp.]|jgi:hydroxymethylglutaryl-CoA lyase
MELPAEVEFREEGPREGFQIEPRVYPLEDRARLVEALAETGLRYIQVASFVSPKAVPQMADSEQLFAAIRKRPGVTYAALWLNEKGFLRALATPGVDVRARLAYYASDAFARRNNGCPAEEMAARQQGWMALYAEHGLKVETMTVLAAFGCNFEGDVPPARSVAAARAAEALCRAQGYGVPKILLADTMGWANPVAVKRLVGAVREAAPTARVGLHLHDTRGLGAANMLAGLMMGVDLFDSSVAGLGGCPFSAPGDVTAAGNICTEDMVFMCHEMGIATGVDLEALLEAAHLAESIIGRRLNGHLLRAGSLARFRAARALAARA